MKPSFSAGVLKSHPEQDSFTQVPHAHHVHMTTTGMSGSMQPSLHASTQATFPFLPIGQAWWYDQFPLLSSTHVLHAFIPALDRLLDAQCEPHGLLVTMVTTGAW